MFVLDKPHRVAFQRAPAFEAAETGLRMNPGGLVLESVPLERRAATLDLVLLIIETQESLAASMRYNTDLFDAATIVRLSQHFELLLRHLLQEPTASVDTLRRTLANANRQQRAIVGRALKEANIQKLKQLKLKPVVASPPGTEDVPRQQNSTGADGRY